MHGALCDQAQSLLEPAVTIESRFENNAEDISQVSR